METAPCVPTRLRRCALWGAAALLLSLPTALALYAAVAWALVLWPNPSVPPPAAPDAVAYVAVQGVHVDLVLPLRSAGLDWTQVFAPQHFRAVPADATHLAIGWGDRAFYLHTPRWRDLTAQRALQALAGSGRSLLHVSYLREADLRATRQQGDLYAVALSRAQHAALVQHVRDAVLWQGPGPGVQAVPVAGAHYTHNDAFFEARGQYNAFQTCNTWVGQGLRLAGAPVSRWTPLSSQVVWHLNPASAQATPPGAAKHW